MWVWPSVLPYGFHISAGLDWLHNVAWAFFDVDLPLSQAAHLLCCLYPSLRYYFYKLFYDIMGLY